MFTKKEPVQKVVLLFDIHAPEQHEPSLKAALSFIKDYKPDTLVLGGDIGEFESVSHWISNKQRVVENKRLAKDYIAVNEVLDRIEKVLPKGCKKVFMVGNHEDWINQYIDYNPQMEGLVELEIGLRLKERGYIVVPLNKSYRLGKLNVIHGWDKHGGKYHAAKHIEYAGKSVIYGHYHQHQVHPKKSGLGDLHSAFAVPCLCVLDKPFLKGIPPNWSHGFATVEVRDSGDYTVNIIDIVRGAFCYIGKVYRG